MNIDMEYCRITNTISISWDGSLHQNIHLSEGFEKAFDRIVDILSQRMDVSVKKTTPHFEDGEGDMQLYFVKSKETVKP